jgi:hypothetical protein
MRVLIVAAVSAVFLAGCGVQLVSTSARSVVIRGGTAYIQQAQNMADAECAKNNRQARLIRNADGYSSAYLFDCI